MPPTANIEPQTAQVWRNMRSMGRERLIFKLKSLIDGVSRVWCGVATNGDLDADGYSVDAHNPMLHHHQAPHSSYVGSHLPGGTTQNPQTRLGPGAGGRADDQFPDHRSAGRALSDVLYAVMQWLIGAAALILFAGLFFLWNAGLKRQLGPSATPTPIAETKLGQELAQATLADKMKAEMRDYATESPSPYASPSASPLITAPPSYPAPHGRTPEMWSGGHATATVNVGRVSVTGDPWGDALKEYADQYGHQGLGVPMDDSNSNSHNPQMANHG